MVVSQIRRPQYRPQYTTVLIKGNPKKVPLILVNYQILISEPPFLYGFADLSPCHGRCKTGEGVDSSEA